MLLCIGGFCVFAITNAANAQRPPLSASTAAVEPIKASLARNKIVIRAGVETKEKADTVKPGDVIEETVTYSNVSDKPISKFMAQLPVPSNTELIVNSLKPSAASASLDGAQYAVIPLKRAAKNANAAMVVVPLNEYRYLRWTQNEINPGKSLTVSARFKVLSNDLNIQPARNDLTSISPSSLGANK